jgi:aldose 1-epimerase
MSLIQSPVLFHHQNEDVYLFTLKNSNGVEITISNLGAIIRSFIVPDSSGNSIDIVLGFDRMEQYIEESYVQSNSYLGAIVGRYANRISNSIFELDSKQYQLNSNHPPHQLHGGCDGFDRKVWKIESSSDNPNPMLVLSYLSMDGEEGFPGNLRVQVSFELNEYNELIMRTEATTDKPTPINLTHHGYFNLNGSGTIEDHFAEIRASYYLGQHKDLVPNGEILSVEDTIYDFRNEKQISRVWNPENGYDQSFVLDKGYGEWGKAAMAYSESSGIKLEVFTDEPTVQFYTGKHLNNKGVKGGSDYSPYCGLCFETQHHTNAVNIPDFPSTILRPGEVYSRRTSYKVSNS